MYRSISKFCLTVACGSIVFCLSSSASAHFLWVKTIEQDGKTQAFLMFGENTADEAYHFPDKLTGVKLSRRTPDGKITPLPTEKIETEERIGFVAPIPADEPCVLETTARYGIYGNSLLTYYTKHVHATSNDGLKDAGPSKELKLDIVPRSVDGKLQLTVLWEGKPLADAAVTLTVPDGEPIEQQTDANGVVTLTPEESGTLGILANFVEKEAKGDFNGKSYTSAANYASLTLNWKADKAASGSADQDKKEAADKSTSAAEPAADQSAARVPPLPEPLSSFGGAVADGWLYVYGGHTGKEHDHSLANLSAHFRRIKLDGGREWEELPMETPLQGIPLVTHGGRLYRIGGLSARNATAKDKEDMHSMAEFAGYDPANGKWTALAALPAGRSSHDAVVIGDKLYVVGGWTLTGPRKGEWHDQAVVYDFNNPDAGWTKLAAQPFRRRALAAGEWHGKLVAMGGMDEDTAISQQVDIFDPATGQWSQGPELPGEGMAGFGLSAWNLGGELYVCGCEGTVYRLTTDGAKWEEVAKLDKPRFFHRLLPGGQNELIVVGGATEDGHVAGTEWIALDKQASSAAGGN